MISAQRSLSSSGGRMTPQRRMILETLESLTDHPTAEQLYVVVHARAPEINRSTVYRTLNWLETEGLVSSRRFNGDQRAGQFDPRPACDHHHFICTECDLVVEFEHPLIDTIIADFQRDHALEVCEASIVLRGVCPACRARLTQTAREAA
jgi:Fe2+ or Zn2+ uptake regulation protein